MSAPAISTSSSAPQTDIYTKMEAAGSLEEQFIIISTALQDAEATYNDTNAPGTPLNAISIQPDFEDASCSITASMRLQVNSASLPLNEAVVEYIV